MSGRYQQHAREPCSPNNLLPAFRLDFLVELVACFEPFGTIGAREIPLLGETQTSVDGHPEHKIVRSAFCLNLEALHTTS